MSGVAVRASLLVVAKAPVPGAAKTRLTPPATPGQAAEIAAAALLDTLDAVLRTPGVRPVVALTGDLSAACRRAELRAALRRFLVLPQRGADFAERLANAHADTARRHGLPVLQIGMDTPQVTPQLLDSSVGALAEHDAVLGPAEDGGWWALGLRDATRARALRDVPMSRNDTGVRTASALRDKGIGMLPTLSDVDTIDDALAVAGNLPGTRFAEAVREAAR
ncbi:rSAM/selenodomain-associated transferase 1 [Saccharothrix coeruleofusca]|uniref:TIGR04282 family arsenosugar biosynthesis glycosyltransferase n=1 Tax=Saccharothrix coeruleofusca TaxID=33919 RepID=UPI0035563483|nr:rSAM/selenodomain-associated transferase 1 [Saccharothrix coeruleofusca]